MKPRDMLEEQEKEAAAKNSPSETSNESSTAKESENKSNQGVAKSNDVEALMAERDKALAEKAELLDSFRRAQADFENARKQMLREKQESQEYAAMDTIRCLLPIVDDFERALGTPDVDNEFRKGLELIHEQILEVFTRAGLRPIEQDGKFNPHLHHAVDRVAAESDEQDQDIVAVYQKGYVFKDRLLRPAMVQVAIKED